MDFAPALESSVKKVFPEIIISHDYFHTSKSLNRALRKEIMRLQRNHYSTPIKEYTKARKHSIDMEKSGKLTKSLTFNEVYLKHALEVLNHLNKLFELTNEITFQNVLNTILTKISHLPWEDVHLFTAEINQIIPNCGITSKNFPAIYNRIFKIWRRLIRMKRRGFETENKEFVKAKYAILQNPSNMNKIDKKLLRKFLSRFKWMSSIRDAVRHFHYQFKAPKSAWRSLKFLSRILEKESHNELRSVIATFIEKEDQIFAYRKIWAEYPHLAGDLGIRSNREEINRSINRVARNQYGFRNLRNMRLRLERILVCPVIISKQLLAQK